MGNLKVLTERQLSRDSNKANIIKIAQMVPELLKIYEGKFGITKDSKFTKPSK